MVRPAAFSSLKTSTMARLRFVVHSGERLVCQVEVRVLGQRPGQKHPLLLAAGELADLAVGEVRYADFLQAPHGLLALLFTGPPQPPEPAV